MTDDELVRLYPAMAQDMAAALMNWGRQYQLIIRQIIHQAHMVIPQFDWLDKR